MSSKPIKRTCPVCHGEVARKHLYMHGTKASCCDVCNIFFPYTWSNPKIFAGLIHDDKDILEFLQDSRREIFNENHH